MSTTVADVMIATLKASGVRRVYGSPHPLRTRRRAAGDREEQPPRPRGRIARD
jgi:hypothetical protein